MRVRECEHKKFAAQEPTLFLELNHSKRSNNTSSAIQNSWFCIIMERNTQFSTITHCDKLTETG